MKIQGFNLPATLFDSYYSAWAVVLLILDTAVEVQPAVQVPKKRYAAAKIHHTAFQIDYTEKFQVKS